MLYFIGFLYFNSNRASPILRPRHFTLLTAAALPVILIMFVLKPDSSATGSSSSLSAIKSQGPFFLKHIAFFAILKAAYVAAEGRYSTTS